MRKSENSYSHLVLSIIAQAFKDYRQAIRRGLISPDGMQVISARNNTVAGECFTPGDAQRLVEFFRPGGGCSKLLGAVKLPSGSAEIRRFIFESGPMPKWMTL